MHAYLILGILLRFKFSDNSRLCIDPGICVVDVMRSFFSMTEHTFKGDIKCKALEVLSLYFFKSFNKSLIL